jgi:Phage integrase, N-terminal SAM-like domain
VNKITVKEFMERWLAHIRPQVVPRTFERYEEIAIKNITPMLGSIIIGKLKPMQISDACATALSLVAETARAGFLRGRSGISIGFSSKLSHRPCVGKC